jgi:rhodanese-related sulfurtransferase
MDEMSSIEHPGGFREVQPAAASNHLAHLRVIDVREPSEFTGPLGHIVGSELLPLSQFLGPAQEWDRDQALLLVCKSGARSGSACRALTQMGFRNVYNLAGGMYAWNQARLPISHE